MYPQYQEQQDQSNSQIGNCTNFTADVHLNQAMDFSKQYLQKNKNSFEINENYKNLLKQEIYQQQQEIISFNETGKQTNNFAQVCQQKMNINFIQFKDEAMSMVKEEQSNDRVVVDIEKFLQYQIENVSMHKNFLVCSMKPLDSKDPQNLFQSQRQPHNNQYNQTENIHPLILDIKYACLNIITNKNESESAGNNEQVQIKGFSLQKGSQIYQFRNISGNVLETNSSKLNNIQIQQQLQQESNSNSENHDLKPENNQDKQQEEQKQIINFLKQLEIHCIQPYDKTSFCNIKKLGQGSQAIVYKVRPTQSNIFTKQKKYALKIINKLESQSAQLECISREIKVMNSLSKTKNVVQLLNIFEDEKSIYLLMDYKRGGNLREYLKQMNCLKESEAKILTYQILKILKKIHNQKVVHRDLTAANILLNNKKDKNQKYYISLSIADFGLSTFVQDLKNNKQKCGTPGYMAPESLRYAVFTDKSDIFSVGCLLFRMLTGENLFQGVNHQEILRKNLFCDISNQLHFNLLQRSNDCRDLISRLLTTNTDDRFTAKEALEHSWFYNIHRTATISIPKENNLVSHSNIKNMSHNLDLSGYTKKPSMLKSFNGQNSFMLKSGYKLQPDKSEKVLIDPCEIQCPFQTHLAINKAQIINQSTNLSKSKIEVILNKSVNQQSGHFQKLINQQPLTPNIIRNKVNLQQDGLRKNSCQSQNKKKQLLNISQQFKLNDNSPHDEKMNTPIKNYDIFKTVNNKYQLKSFRIRLDSQMKSNKYQIGVEKQNQSLIINSSSSEEAKDQPPSGCFNNNQDCNLLNQSGNNQQNNSQKKQALKEKSDYLTKQNTKEKDEIVHRGMTSCQIKQEQSYSLIRNSIKSKLSNLLQSVNESKDLKFSTRKPQTGNVLVIPRQNNFEEISEKSIRDSQFNIKIEINQINTVRVYQQACDKPVANRMSQLNQPTQGRLFI